MDEDNKKICSTCKNEKSLGDFYKHKGHKDGLDYDCKQCCKAYYAEKLKKNNKEYYSKNREFYRNQRFVRQFGISLDEYNELLRKQNNVCSICQCKEIRIDKRTNRISELAVDHDHKTGRIRGLLCYKCNSVLGYANDDIQILKSATNYLLK